jgi:hypothetical protein
MSLPPHRFDYAPINDRPKIEWPNKARVAFWVAPNMEFFEYMPESRPTQPDIPHYARMDYGNRAGFWRMLDILNKHKVRACCCLNLEILDHFPEIKDAMVAADWDYMAHGLYNSRPIYNLTEDQERAIGEVIADLAAGRPPAPGALPGALLTRMSGSGATCFGIFADDDCCRRAAQTLGKAAPGWWIAPTFVPQTGILHDAVGQDIGPTDLGL